MRLICTLNYIAYERLATTSRTNQRRARAAEVSATKTPLSILISCVRRANSKKTRQESIISTFEPTVCAKGMCERHVHDHANLTRLHLLTALTARDAHPTRAPQGFRRGRTQFGPGLPHWYLAASHAPPGTGTSSQRGKIGLRS
jgi:hypothetical protein